jgi:DNA-binding transcriptional ArsR family regulator
MNKNLKKKPVFVVQDLETLRVLTDPLRLQILEVLNREPQQTVGQVAEKLGLASSRLYYHFNMLEEHGLIEVVETRTVSNMIEKLYGVTAEEIEFNKELLNFSLESGKENIVKIIASSLDSVREDMMRSLQARKYNLERGEKEFPREMTLINTKKRLKDEAFQAFTERIKKLLNEFGDMPEEEEGGEDVNVYSLACYLYPSFYYEDGTENKGINNNG